MIAPKIALEFLILTTAIAGGNKFALGGLANASQYQIAYGSHDECGNKFALGLDDNKLIAVSNHAQQPRQRVLV